MSTAKFEKLIDLIINEDQERAEQLFHEIVVEKSREIYEGLMEEDDLEEDMSGSLMQEIETEEEMGEPTMEDEVEDEEISGDFDVEGGDDMEDMGDEDMDDMDDEDMGSEEAATKDDIMDLEDKLDQLLAAFEEEFGAAEEEGGEEEEESEEEEGEEEESDVMEAVEMKKVSVTHSDGADGSAKKGPVAANSGQAGMASKPVKFADGGQAQPTGPKGPSNAYSKGEGQVKGAGQFKNAPGVNGGKTQPAPKPETKQASGVNVKDVVPESKKPVKKMIK